MLQYDEGTLYKSYKDTMGNTTVGIGFNMDDPHARGVWIQADIPESFNLVYDSKLPLSSSSIASLINTCINNSKQELKTIFPSYASYPEYVQLALLNMIFNMGKTVLSEFHTFISLIKENNYAKAATDLNNTKWYNQVPNRAKRVVALLTGDYSNYT